MEILVKTSIKCGEHRHRVMLLGDGTVRSDECPSAADEARKIGALASLGGNIGEVKGCAGLIALCSIGLPSAMERRGVTDARKLGTWLPTYVIYENNPVTKRIVAECSERRDAKHAEALHIARKSLFSAPTMRRYWSDRHEEDERPESLVTFVPDAEDLCPGQIVAETSQSAWTVPLQRGWLESVGKAKPVIDGRFLVGMPEDRPGFVFAIEREDDDVIRVREFAVVSGKLGKVKL